MKLQPFDPPLGSMILSKGDIMTFDPSKHRSVASPPQLKLFSGGRATVSPSGETLAPRMTLREFFDAWMLPIVLQQQRETAEGTRTLYYDAIAWWELTTGNPPLEEIDEWVWSKFVGGLKRAEFKRGPMAPSRPMSPATQTKHQRQIRSILGKAEKKGLVQTFELIIRRVATDVKPDFSLAMARQIAAWLRLGTPQEQRRRYDAIGASPSFWLKFICLGFYTGLRSGEMLGITAKMLETAEDGSPWLNLPAEIVPKTGKSTLKAVHTCLAEAIAAEPLGGPLLPWQHDYRHLLTCHERLQILAGIPEEKVLSPHAWRRTFATQIALTGLANSQALAQSSLSHSSAETTKGHYLASIVEATAIRMLPRLW